jgi:hypothetical protein
MGYGKYRPLPFPFQSSLGNILVTGRAWYCDGVARGTIMAALQERNGSYRILFRHNGKQHTFTLGNVDEGEAKSKASQVEYLLMRLKQRLVELPEGVDIVTFVEFDAVLPGSESPAEQDQADGPDADYPE